MSSLPLACAPSSQQDHTLCAHRASFLVAAGRKVFGLWNPLRRTVNGRLLFIAHICRHSQTLYQDADGTMQCFTKGLHYRKAVCQYLAAIPASLRPRRIVISQCWLNALVKSPCRSHLGPPTACVWVKRTQIHYSRLLSILPYARG